MNNISSLKAKICCYENCSNQVSGQSKVCLYHINLFKDHIRKLFLKIHNKLGPQKWNTLLHKVIDNSQNSKSINVFKLCEILNSLKIEISERSRFKMINAFRTKNDYLDFSFLNDVLENTLERYKVSP